MSGAHKSVLGRNVDPVLKSLVTQMPCPYSLATEDVRINGVIVTIESSGANAGRAQEIKRLCVKSNTDQGAPYDSSDGKPNYNNALL